MYVLGHVGLTVLAGASVRRWIRLPLGWLGMGAMLPDLIDKPVGHFVLHWDAGRLFAHTLLFQLALILIAAVALARSRRVGLALLALALGSAGHLVLDSMWDAPAVLYWPMLGAMPHGHWAPERYLAVLQQSGYVWATEALGAAALAGAWAYARLRRPRGTAKRREALAKVREG